MKYYVVHHTQGRLRVRIPAIRSSSDEREAVLRLLRDIDGVEQVTANQVTGSVLINYSNDALFHWQIINTLNQQGYCDSSKTKNSDASKTKTVTEELIGKAIFNWTVGKALENAGLSFLSVLI